MAAAFWRPNSKKYWETFRGRQFKKVTYAAYVYPKDLFLFILNFRLEFWKAKMSLGIPIKVLHEAEGHVITCESSSGEVYRGKLVEAEEHMNIQVRKEKTRIKKDAQY